MIKPGPVAYRKFSYVFVCFRLIKTRAWPAVTLENSFKYHRGVTYIIIKTAGHEEPIWLAILEIPEGPGSKAGGKQIDLETQKLFCLFFSPPIHRKNVYSDGPAFRWAALPDLSLFRWVALPMAGRPPMGRRRPPCEPAWPL